ncbi:MAG: AAA+ family ATPase, partial [Dehalococcoidia bacterium]
PTWSAVVEADVDGPESTPLAIDRENSTLGRYSATRRVARTIFLGTAPLRGTANRGKGIQQINLGCVQPGESVNTFGDALRRLQNKATYLNTDGELTFYDTAQNINRDAESRKAGFTDDDVKHAIREALKKQESSRGDFARVHACPQSPSDVADDRDARLVILGCESEHLASNDDSPAIESAKELLASRGSGPRIYRNTLAFVAADRMRLTELEDAVRWALAWKAIDEKKGDLDLNQSQIRTVTTKRREWEGVVEQRILETYCWLIVPGQPDPHADIEWHARRLTGQDSLAKRASKKMRTDELLIPQLGAVRLRMELDRVPLWRGDDVEVRQLAEDFAQYLYLPRLTSPNVLLDAIIDGVGLLTWQSDAFAYAESKTQEGRYAGLHCGEGVRPVLDGAALLVKPDAAAAQREKDLAKQRGGDIGTADGGASDTGAGTSTTTDSADGGDKGKQTESTPPRRFYGSVALDSTRLGRDAGRIAEEVIAHLTAIEGAHVKITMEIEAEIPKGVDQATVRAVTENCRTLNFSSQGFERE